MLSLRWIGCFSALLVAAFAFAQTGVGPDGIKPAKPAIRGDRATTVVNGNRRRVLYPGMGRSFVINGNNNRVLITGRVKSIVVNGNRNVVSVVQIGCIDVMGNENRVRWTEGPRGRNPRINNAGSSNAIVRGS